jgi:hypothetical protein
MRYTDSFVGRFPTQIDYSDYRELSGVKMPFKWTVVWLDGLRPSSCQICQAHRSLAPSLPRALIVPHPKLRRSGIL